MERELRIDIDTWRSLIKEDLIFANQASYFAKSETPIHRWYLIPESCSLEWAKLLLDESANDVDYVVDPYCGSGTIALGCSLKGKSFIGGDILADMVIATLAKYNWREISPEILSSIFSELMNESRNKNTNLLGLNQIYEWGRQAQELIINSKVSIFVKYAFLTAIYKSIRSTQRPKYQSLMKNLENNINEMSRDLANRSGISSDHKIAIYYGNSSSSSWYKLMDDIGIPIKKRKGLLITSPTFINTSQDRGSHARICCSLAQLAIQQLNISQFFPTSNHNRYSQKNDYLPNLPSQVKKYIYSLVEILYNFKQISVESSVAIIENENPQIGNEIFEVDLLICLLAKQFGYSPRAIRVTHYVDSPGKITYSNSNRRGSLIYLETRL